MLTPLTVPRIPSSSTANDLMSDICFGDKFLKIMNRMNKIELKMLKQLNTWVFQS